MKYASLIKGIFSDSSREVALAELLEGIDARDKSVPSLEKLNDALVNLSQGGYIENIPNGFYKFHAEPIMPQIIKSVQESEYKNACKENHEKMIHFLESKGISREQQEKTLETYAKLWKKNTL